MLQFASSGKWPNELKAVRRMITAFYINLAARLNNECNLTSQPFVNHIDIMKVCCKITRMFISICEKHFFFFRMVSYFVFVFITLEKFH